MGVQLEEGDKGKRDRLRTFRDAENMSNIANILAGLVREAVDFMLAVCRPDELEAWRKKFYGEVLPVLSRLGPTDVVRVATPIG